MKRTLTLKRHSAKDVIYVPVMITDLATTVGGQIAADFDTGNDHTCIRRDVLEAIGIKVSGRPMPVNGVTGAAMGTVVEISLGFEMDDRHRCTIKGHEVVVLDTMSCQCLLGRDMLEVFDVELTKDGTTVLRIDC